MVNSFMLLQSIYIIVSCVILTKLVGQNTMKVNVTFLQTVSDHSKNCKSTINVPIELVSLKVTLFDFNQLSFCLSSHSISYLPTGYACISDKGLYNTKAMAARAIYTDLRSVKAVGKLGFLSNRDHYEVLGYQQC